MSDNTINAAEIFFQKVVSDANFGKEWQYNIYHIIDLQAMDLRCGKGRLISARRVSRHAGRDVSYLVQRSSALPVMYWLLLHPAQI